MRTKTKQEVANEYGYSRQYIYHILSDVDHPLYDEVTAKLQETSTTKRREATQSVRIDIIASRRLTQVGVGSSIEMIIRDYNVGLLTKYEFLALMNNAVCEVTNLKHQTVIPFDNEAVVLSIWE